MGKVEDAAIDILDALALQVSAVLVSQTRCGFRRLCEIVRVFQAHPPRCAGNELERTPSSALLIVEVLSAAALGLIDAAEITLRKFVAGLKGGEKFRRVH